jgi:hypothetical protein
MGAPQEPTFCQLAARALQTNKMILCLGSICSAVSPTGHFANKHITSVDNPHTLQASCNPKRCKLRRSRIPLSRSTLPAGEFEELHSELRNARSQGGGVHGNAILTKFDFSSWHVLEHSHHPVDWNAAPSQQTHKLAAKEPRRGRSAGCGCW